MREYRPGFACSASMDVDPALVPMTNRVRAASVLVAAALCVGLLGAAGASGQAPSPAAMEAFLLEAELSGVRDAGDGVTGSRRATASDGLLTHDVHIQTVDVAWRCSPSPAPDRS